MTVARVAISECLPDLPHFKNVWAVSRVVRSCLNTFFDMLYDCRGHYFDRELKQFRLIVHDGELPATSELDSNIGRSWQHNEDDCFQASKDIVVPTSTWLTPATYGTEAWRLELFGDPDACPTDVWQRRRKTLAFMVRGKLTKARDEVVTKWKKDPDMLLFDKLDRNMSILKMSQAKYCLQADGSAPWSPRLTQYIALSCVPGADTAISLLSP